MSRNASFVCQSCAVTFERVWWYRPRFCSRTCAISALRGTIRPREPLEQRFWRYVHKGDGCWEWVGHKDIAGYGKLTTQRRKSDFAHRVSYRIEHGSIPDGLDVLHRCDNRACVRPDHIYAGTHAENMRDKMERGRHRHMFSKRADGVHVRHPLAKLTEDQVRDIRRDYFPRKRATLNLLAARYGVSVGAIKSVVWYENWKHVA